MKLITRPISKTITIPGSKSYTNRALIMAALTQGEVTLKSPLKCDDTDAMIDCLRMLGVEIQTNWDAFIIRSDIKSIKHQQYHLFVRDSGTTARFLLALACVIPGIKTIEGNQRLNERPISDLVDALRELGADIQYTTKEGCFPIRVSSSSLSGNCVKLKGDISSQFCSALLMISPALKHELSIHLTTPLISKPYVDMTLSSMREWGVNVITRDREYHIPKGQFYHRGEYCIEGDFSSAAYFFAIAALIGSSITIKNLSSASLQADRQFLNILASMDNEIKYLSEGIQFTGKQILPIDVDMEECPDQIMTMAVLAAFAEGTTRISGIRSLRIKESDRVAATRNELRKMGIHTEESEDVLTIHGGRPQGADIETYGDHRIAMAFAVAATCVPGITILQPEVVNKTFPSFWENIKLLDLFRN